MTIPVNAATALSNDSSTGTHTITMPSGISAGDLLIAVCTVNALPLSATTGWWTVVKPTALPAGGSYQVIYAKIAAGSDTLVITSAGSVTSSAITYRITGHGSAVTAATTTGSNTACDPPNVTQSGSAQDTLFIAAYSGWLNIATAAPSGFTNLLTSSASNAKTSTAELGVAAASSDNPGAFTNANDYWTATTLAIPAGSISTKARITQVPTETLTQVNPKARITQVAPEVLSQVNPKGRITQVAIEVLSSSTSAVANKRPMIQVCG